MQSFHVSLEEFFNFNSTLQIENKLELLLSSHFILSTIILCATQFLLITYNFPENWTRLHQRILMRASIVHRNPFDLERKIVKKTFKE